MQYQTELTPKKPATFVGSSAKPLLSKHYHDLFLKKFRRKLYAVIPPNQTKENVIVDAYLIAAKSAPDSILAYHTALELHGACLLDF